MKCRMRTCFAFLAASCGLLIAVLSAHCSNGPDIDLTGLGAFTLDASFVPFDDAGKVDPRCPESLPAEGAACDGDVECEYGGIGPVLACTTVARCASGHWSVPQPDGGANACVDDAGIATCPASFDALPTGSACPGDLPVCPYAEGRCGCLSCTGEGGATSQVWVCRRYEAPADGCPLQRPRIGTECAADGGACAYGGCHAISFGPDAVCRDGYWHTATAASPDCDPVRCDSLQ